MLDDTTNTPAIKPSGVIKLTKPATKSSEPVPSICNPIANAARAAGSLTAGVLLLRIVWWTQYARIKKDGKAWVVKSRDEWAEEAALTFEQYKDALETLKARKLIETTPGQHGGKRRAFVRATDDAVKAVTHITRKTNAVVAKPAPLSKPQIYKPAPAPGPAALTDPDKLPATKEQVMAILNGL